MALAGIAFLIGAEFLLNSKLEVWNALLNVEPLQNLALLVTGVLFLLWLHRMYWNVLERGGHLTYSPGWAVGCWFVPIVFLFTPYSAVAQLWGVSVSGQKKPKGETRLRWWWACWLLMVITGSVLRTQAGDIKVADDLTSVVWLSLARDGLLIAAAVLLTTIVGDVRTGLARRAFDVDSSRGPTIQRNSYSSALLVLALVFASIMIFGLVVAVAIPTLLRGRVAANEAAAQADIRSVISAQAAYEAASKRNGYAADIACLAAPAKAGCIPGYAATDPTFLDSALAATRRTKAGYERLFTPGTNRLGTGAYEYCYAAWPVTLNRTGTRSFGGDASGVLAGTQGRVNCCRQDGNLAGCPALETPTAPQASRFASPQQARPIAEADNQAAHQAAPSSTQLQPRAVGSSETFDPSSYFDSPRRSSVALKAGHSDARPADMGPGVASGPEPTTAAGWMARGDHDFGMGYFFFAVRSYEKATQLEPTWGLAWNNLGSAQSRFGDYGKAIQSLEHAVALEEKNGVFLFNLGHAYLLKRDSDGVVRVLKQLQQVDPSAANRLRGMYYSPP